MPCNDAPYHENTWPLIKVGVTFFSGRSVTCTVHVIHIVQSRNSVIKITMRDVLEHPDKPWD
jgi:hypothetical protein